MNEKAQESDSNDTVDQTSRGYFATATFINDVPKDWGVTIIEIGCKFIDDDGNNDNQVKTVNIQGGGESFTLKTTHEGCCRGYFGAVKAKDRGQVDVYPFAESVPAGKCGSNLRWHLTPTRYIDQGAAVAELPLQLVLK